MNEMKTSEVLYKAADAIERDGWTRGSEGMIPSGPHCAMGAIGVALGMEARFKDGRLDPGTVGETPAATALADHIGLRLSPRFLWTWNDDQVSAGPVVEALRAAAVIEEAREKGYETDDQPLPVPMEAVA